MLMAVKDSAFQFHLRLAGKSHETDPRGAAAIPGRTAEMRFRRHTIHIRQAMTDKTVGAAMNQPTKNISFLQSRWATPATRYTTGMTGMARMSPGKFSTAHGTANSHHAVHSNALERPVRTPVSI